MTIEQALLGIVPAALVALVVLVAGWRPWSKEPPPIKVGSAGSALAIALAYLVTERLLVGSWAPMPPGERYRWLPYVGLVAAVVAAWMPARGARWDVHDLVALGVFVLLSWKLLASKSGFLDAAIWVVVSTVLAGTIRSDGVRVGACGVRVPLTWWVACVGAALVFVQSSEVIYGQLVGSLAAVMGAFVVIAAWRPRFELIRGLAPVFVVLYVGLVLVSTGMTVVSAVLTVLAACSPALAGLEAMKGLKPWMTTALCMLLAAALSVAAIWQSPNGFNFSQP